MNLYLAGSIELVSFDEAMDWRFQVEDYFRAEGSEINCINPYRNHGEGEKDAPPQRKDAPLITRRDKYLCRSSDFLLANLTTDTGRGTLIEVGLFWEADKPVFAWTHPETGKSLRNHPMLRDIVVTWETDLFRLCDIIMEFAP